jgi:hypothetical protein
LPQDRGRKAGAAETSDGRGKGFFLSQRRQGRKERMTENELAKIVMDQITRIANGV